MKIFFKISTEYSISIFWTKSTYLFWAQFSIPLSCLDATDGQAVVLIFSKELVYFVKLKDIQVQI